MSKRVADMAWQALADLAVTVFERSARAQTTVIAQSTKGRQ